MDSKIEYGLVEMGGTRHLYRERLIINFVKEAKTKGFILDAGCGDGSLSLALAKYGFKVEAFDLASGCVAMLKEKARNADLNGRINCYQGDIREIKFSAGIFDGIVCEKS